jgi:hypothetical protein
MSTQDYKPNSHRYREEQQAAEERKPVEKVTRGVVKTKKNDIRKLTDVFISDDVKNIKSYVLMDVLVPTIKNAIVDIVTNGVNMIFFGGTAGARKSRGASSYVSYSSFANRDRREDPVRSRGVYSYDDIILESRGEAEDVLSRMDELIEMYGEASVADLYDLVGVTGQYTDNRYGWTNLKNAEPVRVRDGYMLKMPKVGPLKQ